MPAASFPCLKSCWVRFLSAHPLRPVSIVALILATSHCSPLEEVNSPPEFTSQPTLSTDHNRAYSYLIKVDDPDGDNITYSGIYPGWLTLDSDQGLLVGTAGWDNLGNANIALTATDGQDEVTQSFILTVNVGEIICDVDFGDPDSSLYILPFRTGTQEKLSQSYCPSNPAWGHSNWFAFDFDTAIGDTIVATRAGTVIFMQGKYLDGNRTPGQENFVFVEHSDGSVMHYMHLTTNGPLVAVGQQVAQGQPIALSGDSGGSIGPHVHVAVFLQRGPFDRQYTLPINFRNAQGSLDANRGLVTGQFYTALDFTPDSR